MIGCLSQDEGGHLDLQGVKCWNEVLPSSQLYATKHTGCIAQLEWKGI